MRPLTSHPNGPGAGFLAGYLTASEACADLPWLDDILSGVLALRTAGDSGTRSLSRRVLFRILQRCEAITTGSIAGDLPGRYSPRTVERYAALARVASRAVEARITATGARRPQTLREARQELDGPFRLGAEAAEAASIACRAAAKPLAPLADPLRDMGSGQQSAPPSGRRTTLNSLIGGDEFP